MKLRHLAAVGALLIIPILGILWSIDVFLNPDMYFPKWVMVSSPDQPAMAGAIACIMPPIIDPVKVAIAIFSAIGLFDIPFAYYLVFCMD